MCGFVCGVRKVAPARSGVFRSFGVGVRRASDAACGLYDYVLLGRSAGLCVCDSAIELWRVRSVGLVVDAYFIFLPTGGGVCVRGAVRPRKRVRPLQVRSGTLPAGRKPSGCGQGEGRPSARAT